MNDFKNSSIKMGFSSGGMEISKVRAHGDVKYLNFMPLDHNKTGIWYILYLLLLTLHAVSIYIIFSRGFHGRFKVH